ncbi:hypothetical protein BABINDRAFT_74872 [Babjeviella inositovora NRRL Y-12698]|uniref:Uncharacterized protein n=1 Tax=Babjeviella inositovora NRRL Y-12698 TaxID=984486 RepID=A0A1E3QYH3_9ASCO|nr:uncharacterized protein BABINDRAFT_74872 [Babjeviella inositovora NRRL Y-12698]ODQ82666.1 hypothetical protein BABINDRAFT_74872 [Babjeviella inositovora NRRL Y-12698]
MFFHLVLVAKCMSICNETLIFSLGTQSPVINVHWHPVIISTARIFHSLVPQWFKGKGSDIFKPLIQAQTLGIYDLLYEKLNM